MKIMRNLSILTNILLLYIILNPAITSAYQNEISKAATAMCTAISDSKKKSVTTIDFTDLKGEASEVGRFLAEEFSVAITHSANDFEIIDRTYLKTILKENGLYIKGMINPKTARQIKKMTGVELLVTGTMTPFGRNIRLSVKLLDIESAKIIDAQTLNIPKTRAFEDLLARSIEKEQVTTMTARKKTISGPAPSPNAILIHEAEGFAFYLQKCIKSGTTVKMAYLVESKNNDKQLTVRRETRLFDNFGNEYNLSKVELGNKTSDNNIDQLLIADIPTKLVFTFDNVADNATMIPMFELNCYKFNIQMRDIAITNATHN